MLGWEWNRPLTKALEGNNAADQPVYPRALSDRGSRPKSVTASFRRIQAHLTEFSDQVASPAIHVVLPHLLSHSLHPHLLLLGLHFESGSDTLPPLARGL